MSIKRNSIYNLVGIVIPLLVLLVTVPIYVDSIGKERFGVLTLIWMLLGYFGFFDLGMGRAVTNRIAATSKGTNSNSHAARIYWTAFNSTLLVGLAAGCTFYATSHFIAPYAIEPQDNLSNELNETFPLLALAFPLVLASSVPKGALAGKERFLLLNAIQVSESVLLQIVPLGLAYFLEPRLPTLTNGVLAVKAFATLTSHIACITKLQLCRLPTWCTQEFLKLIRFGGWLTVSSLVGPLLVSFDRLIIASYTGLTAVTYYAIPYGLAFRLMVLPTSICSALFPSLSRSKSSQQIQIAENAVHFLLSLVTPLTIAGIFLMRPFLSLWIDGDFSNNASFVGETISIGIWTTCIAVVPFTLLQSRGRTDIPAKIYLLEFVPYVTILIVLIKQYGVNGAAAAWSIRCIADSCIFFKIAKLPTGPSLPKYIALITGSFISVQILQDTTAISLSIRLIALSAFLVPLRNEVANVARRLLTRRPQNSPEPIS